MLILRRKEGETIHIGNDIKIVAVRCRDGSVALGIEAPEHVPILRGELLEDATEVAPVVAVQKEDAA